MSFTKKDFFSPSYFVKFLLLIIDQETKQELHSEEVAVTFIERSSKHFDDTFKRSYSDVIFMEQSLQKITKHYLLNHDKYQPCIFYTNQQKQRFKNLALSLKGRNFVVDVCHIETKQTNSCEEVKDWVHELRTKKDSVIWLGNFNY